MENSTVLKNETQWVNEMKSESALLEMDSAEMAFTLEIWPKGQFSFSPKNGFAGEAEKVLLRGYALQTKALSQVLNVAQSELASHQLKRQEKVVLQSESKQKEVASTPSFKWVFALALFLIVVALAWSIRRA